MTNSPPSNVKLKENEPGRVLVSGIDSLVLALGVEWASGAMFECLAGLKEKAKAEEGDEPAELVFDDGTESWSFIVKPHGSQGYEWILTGRELTLRIGNWEKPKQRPSVMAEVRSETLWTHGVPGVIARLLQLLSGMGGKVVSIKPSRVDLCVDILIPASAWRMDLTDCFVTRAQLIDPHLQTRRLSGFSIGRGKICARLYDKPLEIRKSGKLWMYDAWGIASVDEGERIIRVEFQIRRESLRKFDIDTWDDLRVNLGRIWAYCTECWLRIVEDATLHHTQQHILPWWSLVRNGYAGAQGALPIVRARAILADKKRLAAQAIGNLASLASLDLPDAAFGGAEIDLPSMCRKALAEAEQHINIGGTEATRRILRKRAKYRRSASGFPGDVARSPAES